MKTPQEQMWNAWVWYADADDSESDLDFVGAFETPELAAHAVRDAYWNRRGVATGSKPLGQIQWGPFGMAHDVCLSVANVLFTDANGERVTGRA